MHNPDEQATLESALSWFGIGVIVLLIVLVPVIVLVPALRIVAGVILSWWACSRGSAIGRCGVREYAFPSLFCFVPRSLSAMLYSATVRRLHRHVAIWRESLAAARRYPHNVRPHCRTMRSCNDGFH